MRPATAGAEQRMTRPKPLLSKEERRARRQERRAKQRIANVGRARKMHIARLAWEAEARKTSSKVVAADDHIPKLNIGCSGWFYWHWKNRFYPLDLKTADWFSHYAKHFDTVELNAPFYSWPTLANVQSWIRQTKSRPFFYTVKVCELITHVKKFTRTKTLVKDFGFIDHLLRPHMGCFLFQFPPSFHFTAARLKNILGQLDSSHRNVVEFRHRSWWIKPVFRAFEKSGTIFCSCSAPNLPDDLVQTTDEIYIRFHGKKRWYRHDYASDELAVWTDRIRADKPKRVWAYFNNDNDAYAIANAVAFHRQLRKLFPPHTRPHDKPSQTNANSNTS